MDPQIVSLFSGYGGLEMGVQSVLGGEVVAHVEFDAAPSKILAHRFPGVPNLGDITTVDWAAFLMEHPELGDLCGTYRPGLILTGGFPCQDLSLAGRRAGMRPGNRSGLWADFLKAIDELRPGLVVIENVRGLLSGCAESEADRDLGPCPRCADPESGVPHAPNVRALGRVVLDLARIGYVGRWAGVRAADAGAPHGRFRVFIVAYPTGKPWGVGYGDDVRAGGGAVGREQAARRGAVADSGGEAVGLRAGLRAIGQRGVGRGRSDHDRVQDAAADAGGERFGEHSGESSAEEAGAFGGDVADGAGGPRSAQDWGPYRPAIERWERTTGRVAPAPTRGDSRDGGQRLSPVFVEWMMGLPVGWVTAPEIGLSRNEQLKALGNGVVPQQAALAVRSLLEAERVAS